jgi:hypothetical protein
MTGDRSGARGLETPADPRRFVRVAPEDIDVIALAA